MANVTYTPRRTTWDPTWNGNALGTTNKVTNELKYNVEPITRGTTGKMVLGHWVYGLMGLVRTELPDVGPTLFTNINPFASDSGIMHPSTVINLYNYAQLLTLHPHDLGATTEDQNFVKAVPLKPQTLDRDGVKDDVLIVDWWIYPDLSKLFATPSVIVFGWMGASGSEPTA